MAKYGALNYDSGVEYGNGANVVTIPTPSELESIAVAPTLGGPYPHVETPWETINVEAISTSTSTSAVVIQGAAGVVNISARAVNLLIGAPAVPGDMFASPILLGASGTQNVDLSGSTWETGEPETNSVSNVKTIWLRYPSSSGLLTVTSTETSIPWLIEIFSGDSLGALTLAATAEYHLGDDPNVSDVATAMVATTAIGRGEFIYIRVSPRDGATLASFPVAYSLQAVGGLDLTLGSSNVGRTPAVMAVSVSGADPNAVVTFEVLDGVTVVATSSTSANGFGNVDSASVVIPALAVGSYSLRATSGAATDTEDFDVTLPPIGDAGSLGSSSPPSPGTQPPDVVRWVIEDPSPGGLGTYTVPINPEKMTSPWPQRLLQTERTVADDGVEMTWASVEASTDWQFTGAVITQAHYDKINAYAALNRRIYITDHRSRTWIVGIREIAWEKIPAQTNEYAWRYTVSAEIFGTLTALPGLPAVDPNDLVLGYDSNGVKLSIPTATLSGSTINVTATITTLSTLDFTLLQLVAEPIASGTGFSMPGTLGPQTGNINLSGSGEIDNTGRWMIRVAYSLTPSPVAEDVLYGPAAYVQMPTANPSPPIQPDPSPGSGITGSGFPWLGASEKEAADGSLASWLGSTFDVGGTWADTYEAQTEQWAVQSGAMWGSWNKPLDLAVGAIFKTNGQTWASAAGGSYDTRWQTALNRIATGWGSRSKSLLYLSFARECNGSFNSHWSVNSGERLNYIAAFQRFVNMARATLPGCKIVWSLNDGSSTGFDFRTAYPGDGYVDVIGVDTYNSWPHVTSQSAFDSKIVDTDSYGCPTGIEGWRLFAASHGKPMCLPEWGNDGNPSSAGGGGESPLYIQAMHNWMKQHAGSGSGQLLYAVYFNQWSQYRLWPSTMQPATAAKWRDVMRSR